MSGDVRKRRRRTRLIVVSVLAVSLASAASASADHSEAFGAGEGPVEGTLTFARFSAPMCAEYSNLRYESNPPPPYVATYEVNTLAYAGPVTTYYNIAGTTYQNAAGSHAASDCSDPPGAVFSDSNGTGDDVVITGATDGVTTDPLTGNTTTLDCDYNRGSYSRIAGTVTVELIGSCRITTRDSSGEVLDSDAEPTHEIRVNEQVFQPPAPSESMGYETFVTDPEERP